MKKNIIILSIGVILISNFVLAGNTRSRLIAKYAQFQHFEPSFKEIQGTHESYGGELSVGISEIVDLWFSGMYSSYNPHPSSINSGPTISLIPIELGLKFKLPISFLTPYVGGGVVYTRYVESAGGTDLNLNGIGYCGQMGFIFPAATGKSCSSSLFVIDIFINYSVCRINYDSYNFDTGGLRIGIGWGFSL
ncbi:MAG: hypothetical protein JW755_10070 [Candidatus Aminicenantes bacterium]|nr:hypothetical protein [Candidatus Aminicenantes bacterium]